MAITQAAGRQEVICATVDISYADLTSGTAADAVELPQNAVILGGFFVVDTAFDSATSDTITIGDATDEDRYAAGINGQSAALTALTPTGYKYLTQDDITITWTGVGTAPSAGAARLVVYYLVAGRTHFSQG